MTEPAYLTNGHAALPVGQVVIPLPTDQELLPEVAAQVAKVPPLNVTRMFAGTDDLFASLAGLVSAVFNAQGIDIKLREIIILRAAHLLNAPYETQANTIFAQNAGVTDAQIAALAKDGPVQGLDEEATLICQATDELTRQATLTDATLQALLTRYGNALTRKFVVLIAWFNMLSLFLNGTRVQLETDTSMLKGRTSPTQVSEAIKHDLNEEVVLYCLFLLRLSAVVLFFFKLLAATRQRIGRLGDTLNERRGGRGDLLYSRASRRTCSSHLVPVCRVWTRYLAMADSIVCRPRLLGCC